MAKHGKLRTYLEYAPVKLVLMTLGRLPARMSYGIGRSMGKIGLSMAGDLRRTGAINLRLAFPEKTDEERAALLRECFDSLGRRARTLQPDAHALARRAQAAHRSRGWENLEKPG
jgi:KDO2-lipid IV(A) lauroyltransferase